MVLHITTFSLSSIFKTQGEKTLRRQGDGGVAPVFFSLAKRRLSRNLVNPPRQDHGRCQGLTEIKNKCIRFEVVVVITKGKHGVDY